MSIPVHHSVVCAEDVPFYPQASASGADAAAEKGAYLGEAYRELEKLCQYWPAAKIPAEFRLPIRSDVPVLLLSGEADPVTPPSNAAQVAATLSHSLQLVAPGQGHAVITRGCLYRVAASFVDQGRAEGLETSCVDEIKPLPFFLKLTGTKP